MPSGARFTRELNSPSAKFTQRAAVEKEKKDPDERVDTMLPHWCKEGLLLFTPAPLQQP